MEGPETLRSLEGQARAAGKILEDDKDGKDGQDGKNVKLALVNLRSRASFLSFPTRLTEFGLRIPSWLLGSIGYSNRCPDNDAKLL
jgi:hypothetical protein